METASGGNLISEKVIHCPLWRIRATEFLVRATHEPEREVQLIGMSESWLRLAVQADQIQVLVDHVTPVIP